MRLPRDVLAFTVWRNYTGPRHNLVDGRIEVQYGNGADKRNQYLLRIRLSASLPALPSNMEIASTPS